MPIICVSGGFDNLHVGHVRMFNQAAMNGTLIVILNSDEWLKRKKGYFLMPWKERAELIRNLSSVFMVEAVDDSDGTVCEALRRLRPDYFANGGDRFPDNTPELKVCEELGIGMLFGVGGKKITSSQEIARRAGEIL